jgi:predicted metalloprotease with PDZ domain
MRKIIKITFGLLLFFIFGGNTSANSPTRIGYEATPRWSDGAPKIKIAVNFKGDKSGATKIRMPSQFGGQSELYKSVQNLKLLTPNAQIADGEQPEIKIVKHASGAEIRLEYEIIQDWQGAPQAGGASQNAGGGYRPILQKDYFHLLGSGAWILPDLYEDARLRVSIVWKNVPANWTLASSFGANQTRQNFATDVKSFVSSVFVGGDFQIRQRSVKGKPIFMAQRGKWKFTNDEFADLVEKIVLVQRDFWRDHDQSYFLVTLIPLEADPNSLSIGGTGLTDSFATFVTPNASLENLKWLIAHEYFHNWNSPKLGGLQEPEQSLYWFSEGFTDYYTYLLLLRGGLSDLETHAAKYNEFLADYYLSPFRNESNETVVRDFFKNYQVGKLAYRRGFLLATKWNKIIREQSGGAKSLDDAMREIFRDAKTKKHGKLSKERIVGYLAKYAEHDFAADVEKYIERGETIGDFAGALGDCVESFSANLGRFELGFDFNVSMKENRIVNLSPGSAAFDAGLREGQKISGRSIYYDNPNQPVELTIEENGQRKKISYLPVTKAKIATPQFKLKENLSAEARRRCEASF